MISTESKVLLLWTRPTARGNLYPLHFSISLFTLKCNGLLREIPCGTWRVLFFGAGHLVHDDFEKFVDVV